MRIDAIHRALTASILSKIYDRMPSKTYGCKRVLSEILDTLIETIRIVTNA